MKNQLQMPKLNKLVELREHQELLLEEMGRERKVKIMQLNSSRMVSARREFSSKLVKMMKILLQVSKDSRVQIVKEVFKHVVPRHQVRRC